MQNLNECYIITRRSREQHLGVAQLGSALEWGSRGRKFKSSHPDQSVADLTRPRRFLMKASLTRSVAPLYSAARKCEPFIRSAFLRSTPKLSLFHSFPLAGLCLPLNALSHIIPKCMRPPLFGLNSSATLSSENSFESIAHSFRRSALFRCAEMRAVHSLLVSPLHSKLSLFHSFPLAAEVGWILSNKCAVLLALSGVRRE